MDVEKAHALQTEIAGNLYTVLRALGGERIVYLWARVSGESLAVGRLIAADGGESRPAMPRDLPSAFLELKRTMVHEQGGTWFSAEFTVSADGDFEVDYNYDRRVWFDGADPFAPGSQPDDADWAAELELFPRVPEAVPVWLGGEVAPVVPDATQVDTEPVVPPAATHRSPVDEAEALLRAASEPLAAPGPDESAIAAALAVRPPLPERLRGLAETSTWPPVLAKVVAETERALPTSTDPRRLEREVLDAVLAAALDLDAPTKRMWTELIEVADLPKPPRFGGGSGRMRQELTGAIEELVRAEVRGRLDA